VAQPGDGGAAPVGGRPRGQLLQSVQRAAAVLEELARAEGTLSARAISERTGVDRTVTHRLLRTLESEGLVRQERGAYSLGTRTLAFGNSFLRHDALRHAALPFQVDLLYRGFVGRPWALSVVLRVGSQMTQVSQIWSPTAPLDSILSLSDFPIDQTAAGRCILAYLDRDAATHIVAEQRLDELEPRFEAIRAAGGLDFVRSMDRADAPAGVSALSALIQSRGGHPIAGLTLSGSELESELARDSAVAVRLLRTAQQIGARIP
jgi:DNA-binding IclR family transcriptional regulator